MNKSIYKVSKMDCASEEQLIRMKLESDSSIKQLAFDIPGRKVTVFHLGAPDPITRTLESLRLDSQLLETVREEAPQQVSNEDSAAQDKKLLITVLLINFSFFLLEIITGFLANSMGLVADSLDMLADALVYGMSLYAVSSTVLRKKQIARASGYFQLGLAVFGLVEVVRRFIGMEAVPAFEVMIGISLLALVANAVSLYLLQRSRSQEAHMQASQVFTSNDVIANLGVILAGVLVYLTESKLPDLLIGTAVFLLVARGAFRIFQLSK